MQTALARELCAFVWEAMSLVMPRPEGSEPFQRRPRPSREPAAAKPAGRTCRLKPAPVARA